MDTVTADMVTAAATARLIRKQLAQAFPGVTFSVRSRTFAGGASVDVEWTDGPRLDDVQAIAGQYSGAGFDAMIDLKHHRFHWLLPDGTTVLAHDEGSEGAGGQHPRVDGPAVAPAGARLVHFCAHYINCTRRPGEEALARAREDIAAATGRPFDSDAYITVAINGRTRRGYGNQIMWELAKEGHDGGN